MITSPGKPLLRLFQAAHCRIIRDIAWLTRMIASGRLDAAHQVIFIVIEDGFLQISSLIDAERVPVAITGLHFKINEDPTAWLEPDFESVLLR